MSKFRNFCFTYFNEGKDFRNDIDYSKVDYYLCGLETCPETGRLHWQGYAKLTNANSLENCQRIMNIKDAHIEKAKGNYESNYDYCTRKTELCIYEYGEYEDNSGIRTDLDEIKNVVLDTGMVPIDLIKNGQQLSYAEKLIKYAKTPEIRNVEVQWIYGESGCGKTFKAYNENNNAYWITNGDLSNYGGQETIIFDDFDSKCIEFKKLLRICDKYPFWVNIKYGGMYARWTKVIFTHTKSIYDTWPELRKNGELYQLERRLTDIVFLARATEVNKG